MFRFPTSVIFDTGRLNVQRKLTLRCSRQWLWLKGSLLRKHAEKLQKHKTSQEVISSKRNGLMSFQSKKKIFGKCSWMVVSIGIRRIYDLDPSTVVAGSSILLPYFPFSIFTPPGLWVYLCLDLHTAVISVCIAFIWASEIREAHKMLLEIITIDYSDLSWSKLFKTLSGVETCVDTKRCF